MAGLKLENMINDTLAGNNKALTEMSGAVLQTIIDDNTHAGKLIQDTLTQDTLIGSVSNDSAPLLGSQLMPGAILEMGHTERLFWVLIFSVMVLVAAGGNTIVVYIVATNKEMKSVTNYFLVNLSLADTMVSTLNVIFNFISMLNSHWPFGKVYCKISNFIAILSISASVFTLTAISCDRYNAIIHPLRPRMSHRHAIGWILLIWTLSSALALPNLIYSTDLEDRLTNDSVAVTCTMLWPDGRYPLSSYDHIYNIVVLIVTYLVPILTMAILYYKVGKELWGYEAIGENIDKQQRAIMAKKKIVKMMIVVVIIFALCWLPYHAFFVVNFHVPTIFQDSPLHYQRCYLFMYWLAMSNSMYNPIIIYFMNSKFRHEFKKILCLICCCGVYKPPLRPSSTTTGNQNHHHHHPQPQRATNDSHFGQRPTLQPKSIPADGRGGPGESQTPSQAGQGPMEPASTRLNDHSVRKEDHNEDHNEKVAVSIAELNGGAENADTDDWSAEKEPFMSALDRQSTVNGSNGGKTEHPMDPTGSSEVEKSAQPLRNTGSCRLIDLSINNANKNRDRCSNNTNRAREPEKVWI